MSRLRVHILLPLLLAALPAAAAPAASAAPPASPVRHVQANGISIGYWTVGRGRPLVMIPGFGFTMIDWDPRLIDALARHHRVVMFDNRGVATSTDTANNTLTIGEMAKDTAGLIRALHLRRPDVLGWSMGGYIAQDLALAHPGLVRRLVLASSDFGGQKAKKPSRKVRSELGSGNLQELMALLFPRKARAAGSAWFDRVGRQARRRGFSTAWYFPSVAIATQQYDAAASWEDRGHGSYARLPHLRVPTLIAAGDEDVIVPPQNATMMLGRISGSTLLMYAGAGHAFLFQNPLAVAAQVNAFVG